MMGGLAYMTGPSGKSLRADTSVINVTGGMFGVIGILAALEERHRTGKGQKIIATLFETAVYLFGQHMAQFAVTGKPAAPMLPLMINGARPSALACLLLAGADSHALLKSIGYSDQ